MTLSLQRRGCTWYLHGVRRERKKERDRERECQRTALDRGAGVYTLLFPSNAIYVGASFRVKARLRDQLARLRTGRHENHVLQAVFDSFAGQVKVTVRELPIATPDELAVFEQVLIREQLLKRSRDLVLNRAVAVVPIMLSGPRPPSAA